MNTARTLAVLGYENHPVPVALFEQPAGASHLLLVLPGVGYTCQMPLLYYPTLLFLHAGAEVAWVQYDYTATPAFAALDAAGQRRWFLADVEAAAAAALQHDTTQGHP